MDLEVARDGLVDLLEKRQDVCGGVRLVALGEDLASGDVQRREQVGRPVALVVMGHRARPAADHRQARLGPVQRLALGFLVEAEHRCLGRPRR